MRSTWITGINALSMGTHPMRSCYDIPHDRIKYYPDYLREAGYYCTNHEKTDYNIGGRPDNNCWNGETKYGWQKRKEGQPFFAVINHVQSHESRAFGNVNNTKHDPEKAELHKYHPAIAAQNDQVSDCGFPATSGPQRAEWRELENISYQGVFEYISSLTSSKESSDITRAYSEK